MTEYIAIGCLVAFWFAAWIGILSEIEIEETGIRKIALAVLVFFLWPYLAWAKHTEKH